MDAHKGYTGKESPKRQLDLGDDFHFTKGVTLW